MVDCPVFTGAFSLACDLKTFKLSLAYGRDYNGKFNTAGSIKNIGDTEPTVAGEKVIGFYDRVAVNTPLQQWNWALS